MDISQMISIHQLLRVVDIADTAIVLGMMDIWRRTFVCFTDTGGTGGKGEIHLVDSSKVKVVASSV